VKIRYTAPAFADLSLILDYIAEHSPQGANRVQARVQGVIELLTSHPHIGVRTEDPGSDDAALSVPRLLRSH
jgi:toxin ParE1/3/4